MKDKSELTLETISNWILKGITSGYYPHWEISFTRIPQEQLSFSTFNHIAKNILFGIKEGEIIEEKKDKKIFIGWWKLKILDE